MVVLVGVVPESLYTVDDFIDGIFLQHKNRLTKREDITYAFLVFCRCTVCLSMDGGHTSYRNICDIRVYPSFISRLITVSDLD